MLALLLAAAPVGAALSWLPPVADAAHLPASGNVLGDSRLTLDDGARYWWDGDSWELPPAGAGVTSVALAAPSLFSVTGSPVTTTGTLTLALATQSANAVFAGPTTGSGAAPTFRALVGADLPAPSSSTLGGVQSIAAVTSNWLRAISTSGVPSASQPAFSDLSGAATDAQIPNNITVDLATQAAGLTATLGVAGGGTGATSLTAYAPVCGGTTSTGAVQSCGTGQSNAGYVYTSNGGSALPSWQAASGGGGVPGSNGQCIFNDNGALGADGGCSYDKAVNALSVDLVWTNGVRDAAGNTAIDLSAGSFLYAGGGFRLKWNSPSGSFSTYIVPVTNAHDLWLGGIPTTTTYDLTPGTIGLWGIAAAAAASTNIVGGMVPIKGGDGASGSSGDAHGGNVLLDGGRGYGTGNDGQIVIGNTRGSLRLTPRSTPPIACSGHEGTFYIDSDTHKPCYCNGTTYVLFSDDTTTCS